jgi:hypothetical protein
MNQFGVGTASGDPIYKLSEIFISNADKKSFIQKSIKISSL